MRFVIRVILIALVLLLLYVIIGLFADAYMGANMIPNGLKPDWSAPTLAQWRDVFIILMGLWFALAFLLLCVLLAALVFLVLTIRSLVKNNVAPAVDSLKEALDNVKGTTEFVGETAVAPIVRVYSVVRGVRSGVGAVTGLSDRIRGRKKK
jgi:hypothetical protein